LATGLDEDYRKPKNLADQVVRLLDDEDVPAADRIRLILQYVLYRDGLLSGDITKLLAHAQLPPQDGELISNLNLLGARVVKPLKDSKPPPTPLFARKLPPAPTADVSGLSRFETAVRLMLEDQVRGTLDQTTFPFTRPHLDSSDGLMGQDNVSTASLRAKPTWAKAQRPTDQPKQRIIVFMAGGATYAEARACYEISNEASKDVYLATSHMFSPGLFLRQLGDLGVDRRRLDIPADRPKPKAPAHLFEQPQRATPPPSAQSPQKAPRDGRSTAPPTAQMGALNIKAKDKDNRDGKAPNGPQASSQAPQPGGKLKKDKEKKKHHFF
jgi:syntaxin-binding protein 1